MKDMKNYGRYNNSTPNHSQQTHHEDNANTTTDQEDIKRKVDYYSTMNENQLYEELFKEVVKGKQNGTLTREGMMNFYNTVIPMLNNEQRKKLDEIIKKLDI